MLQSPLLDFALILVFQPKLQPVDVNASHVLLHAGVTDRVMTRLSQHEHIAIGLESYGQFIALVEIDFRLLSNHEVLDFTQYRVDRTQGFLGGVVVEVESHQILS